MVEQWEGVQGRSSQAPLPLNQTPFAPQSIPRCASTRTLPPPPRPLTSDPPTPTPSLPTPCSSPHAPSAPPPPPPQALKKALLSHHTSTVCNITYMVVYAPPPHLRSSTSPSSPLTSAPLPSLPYLRRWRRLCCRITPARCVTSTKSSRSCGRRPTEARTSITFRSRRIRRGRALGPTITGVMGRGRAGQGRKGPGGGGGGGQGRKGRGRREGEEGEARGLAQGDI